jgi:hypothetical protein
MLLLGVVQAQASGAGPLVETDFDLLQTEILTGSQASVTFSDLNSTYGSTYQHLQIRMVVRTDRATTSDNIRARVNGDTGSNYAYHGLFANGSTVGAKSAGISQTVFDFDRAAAATASSGIFGAVVLDILDPFETSKYITFRTLGGVTTNTINLGSGLWMDTDAMSSFSILPGSGSNFVTGSRFSLYGLKASV